MVLVAIKLQNNDINHQWITLNKSKLDDRLKIITSEKCSSDINSIIFVIRKDGSVRLYSKSYCFIKITIEKFYAPLNIEFIYILYNQTLLENKVGIYQFMT